MGRPIPLSDMSIVHLVSTLEVGGLERVVLSLSRVQKDRGHRVAIACLFSEGVLASEARDAGIPVFDCAKRTGFDLKAVRALRRLLRDSAAQVLHTHNAVPHYYGVAAAAGLGLRRIVSTRHNMGVLPYSARRELLYRIAMRSTHYGVSVCDAAQRTFIDSGAITSDKAVTIPNGVETRSFSLRDDEARGRLARSLDLPEDALVLITVGRLEEVKNHAAMLDALRVVRTQGVAAALIVVGDGCLRQSLEQMAVAQGLGGMVRFLGRRSDIPMLLASADVFVQTSLTEGYSVALVEAACAGLPCIVTDVGGNSEIVRDGESGILIDSGDVPALVDAIGLLARAPEVRARMSAGALRWAHTHASVESMYEAYLKLYQDTVQ